VTAHFEHKGAPVSLLLDIVEVGRSHSGVNLAVAFAGILEEFGITNKVSGSSEGNSLVTHHEYCRYCLLPAITQQATIL